MWPRASVAQHKTKSDPGVRRTNRTRFPGAHAPYSVLNAAIGSSAAACFAG